MKTTYSIGHSTRPFEEFVNIIEGVQYDILVDVRSKPYSRRNPQFNRHTLEKMLGEKYLWLGDSLGGMDENISENQFAKGIQEIILLAQNSVVVFMCAEKDHTKCHRHWKIEPALYKEGYSIVHI